jgi:peroxiredoxin
LDYDVLIDSSWQIRFLGDPSGKFTQALDLSFDSSAIFGNDRSKRYVLLVEDGKVKEAFVEPDNTGLNGKTSFLLSTTSYMLTSLEVSTAEKVLG